MGKKSVIASRDSRFIHGSASDLDVLIKAGIELIRLIEYRLELEVNAGRLKVKDTHMATVFLMRLFEQTVFYSMLMPAKPEPHELAIKISDFMLHGLGFRDNP
jgi:hypothetical protein